MANGLSDIANRLKQLPEVIQKGALAQIEKVALESAQVAQELIIESASDLDGGVAGAGAFTQKHGEELANWINVEKDGNRFRIVAGADAPEEIKYELYFAEYGAGIATDYSLGSSSNYIPKPNHTIHNGGEWDGYWTYSLPNGEALGNDGEMHDYGFTNQSIPLHYMGAARQYARDELGKRAKDIKTAIRRVWGKNTSVKIGDK